MVSGGETRREAWRRTSKICLLSAPPAPGARAPSAGGAETKQISDRGCESQLSAAGDVSCRALSVAGPRHVTGDRYQVIGEKDQVTGDR